MKLNGRIDLTEFKLVDNHCHSLLKDCLKIKKNKFRSSFTESFDQTVISNDLNFSVNYNHVLAMLGEKFDCTDEASYIEVRSSLSQKEHIRALFEEANFQALMVDDGLAEDSMIPIDELGSLSGSQVYRVLRIETELERLVSQYDTVEEILEQFAKLVFEPQGKIVGLKTIAAYRGGLCIREVSREVANTALSYRETNRMNGDALHHYLLMEILQMIDGELPVQIHCGFGDIDLQLDKANPSLLTPIFKDPQFKDNRFVLLHCYPYIEEACYLSSVFPNVYIDLSLSPFIVSPKMTAIYSTAVSTTPTSKILSGTDGHSIPETHWYGAMMTRRGLGEALDELIERGFVNLKTAEEIARSILSENALSLYRIV